MSAGPVRLAKVIETSGSAFEKVELAPPLVFTIVVLMLVFELIEMLVKPEPVTLELADVSMDEKEISEPVVAFVAGKVMFAIVVGLLAAVEVLLANMATVLHFDDVAFASVGTTTLLNEDLEAGRAIEVTSLLVDSNVEDSWSPTLWLAGNGALVSTTVVLDVEGAVTLPETGFCVRTVVWFDIPVVTMVVPEEFRVGKVPEETDGTADTGIDRSEIVDQVEFMARNAELFGLIN